MTGMDVLLRVRAYEKDIGRLRLRRMCAYDAATDATRPQEATGSRTQGPGGDRTSRYALAVDDIDREIAARDRMREMETAEAARLVSELNPVQGQAMYLYYVRGMTIRQTAGQMRISESSVRGHIRRGREAMEAARSALEEDAAYSTSRSIYRGK